MRSLLAALLLLAAAPAGAEDFPSRPVRLVTAQAAGSSVDIIARYLAQKLSEDWGQQVVVDNRPGANGIIGMDLAAKAKPDGYTFAMAVPSAMTVNQFIYKSLPYQPLRDFAPVTQATALTFGLVVNPDLPAKSVAELVALAKAKPGALNYSSSGIGNLNHLAGELFAGRAGVALTHIPNKGDTPALLDVLSGETQMMFATMPGAVGHVKAGKLRLLAVCGTVRDPEFPDVPTLAEAGLDGVVVTGWTGIVAPAGTPKDAIDTMQRAVARHLLTAEAKATLSKQGAVPVASAPAAFGALLEAEAAKWAKVVADAGIGLNE